MKKENTISMNDLPAFKTYLLEMNRSERTIKKYVHDVTEFIVFLAERELTKTLCGAWKEELKHRGLAVSTINARISAVNTFFKSFSLDEFHMHSLRIQRKCFRDDERDLSRQEYERLLQTAGQEGDMKLKLIMETLCSAGIRVSELHYITVEALENTSIRISLKGKIREILLPSMMIEKLKAYAREQGITSGEIFLTDDGKPISRQLIWSKMKAISRKAGVDPKKVYPHNLRHLFARCFYQSSQDIVKLADVLGHSNIQTTRIYLISTGEEHRKQIDSLGLVSCA